MDFINATMLEFAKGALKNEREREREREREILAITNNCINQ